jgi:(p)ppGpp synthase/HD superfamily hydrolase
MNSLKAAHKFAEDAHKGQTRKFTGRPYIEHLKETAQNLWEATDGTAENEDYIAALLHDVVEDTGVPAEEIGRNFGGTVKFLVEELTTNEEERKKLGKEIYLAKKMDEVSDRALTIKLSDRLSNVSGLIDKEIPIDFVKRYFNETKYIIDNLDRELDAPQKYLVDKIKNMLNIVTINRLSY